NDQSHNGKHVPQVLVVKSVTFILDIRVDNTGDSQIAFQGDLELLKTPVLIEGKLSKDGLELTGSLKSPGSFAGFAIDQFTLSFSTLPDDQHFFVDLQVDLPGQGGLTHVRGSFQNQTLTLDGSIAHWQPLPTFDFNGTVRA